MNKAFRNKTKEHFFDLREKLGALPDASEQILRSLRHASVINSGAIDFETVDPLFLHLAPDRIPDRKWDRISSYYQNAMLETQTLILATERLEEIALSKRPLTVPFLLQLHRSVFERTRYSNAGKLRTSRDFTSITGHELPHQSKLPEMIEHHLSWLMHRLSIFSAASSDNFLEMFHIAAEGMYRFADSLPLECGNGRFTRLLGTYVLLYTGLFHNIIAFEDRTEYFDAVKSSAIDNLAPLVDFLVKCFAQSLDRIDGFVHLAWQQQSQMCNSNLS